MHIAAAIDVNAIAVGVDCQIVDGEVVHTSCEDSEMPAMQNAKVAQQHVSAVLQCDGLVASAWLLRRRTCCPATAQPLPPDESATNDRDILQPFAPNQTVV